MVGALIGLFIIIGLFLTLADLVFPANKPRLLPWAMLCVLAAIALINWGSHLT